jgi:hypothetical protein
MSTGAKLANDRVRCQLKGPNTFTSARPPLARLDREDRRIRQK